jgi:hypothetical protein
MDTVSIEIDSRWIKIARSPFYFIIYALRGISVTFIPFFFYSFGRRQQSGRPEWLVPLCFAIIFLVAVFYFSLGDSVIRQIRRTRTPPVNS